MGWIGTGIGALLGSRAGGNLIFAIIGGVVGNWVENKIKSTAESISAHARSEEAVKGEMTILAAISAMMSKMAKADGRITADEVRYCESVFDRLGLSGEKREYCVRVFRMAKNDSHTIYEYADSFTLAQEDLSVREIVYDVLWDLACADGVVSPEELAILRRITANLLIPPSLFNLQCSQRGIGASSGRQSRRRGGASAYADRGVDPYEILGVSRDASDEEIKRAYRQKAKALHPDKLRAEGLSEELMGRANEQMAKINEAWAQIKQERGIK